MTALRNTPKFNVTARAFCASPRVDSDGPFNVTKMLVKSMPPTRRPISGVKMSLTRLFTTAVKATPIMMPTARSTTLPRMMKARNSSSQAGLWTCSGTAARSLIARLPGALNGATPPFALGRSEAVQVHHLGPRRHEVLHKLLLRVRARIDFREGAQLRVRTKDQVDTGAGPLDLARLPVAPLVQAFGASCRLPFGSHVEQVDEEVVRQRLRPLGEDAVRRPPDICAEHAQTADENRHLGRRQG